MSIQKRLPRFWKTDAVKALQNNTHGGVTLLEKPLLYWCFPENISKFSSTAILHNTCVWLVSVFWICKSLKNQLFNDTCIRNFQIVTFLISAFYLSSILKLNAEGGKDIATIPLASSSFIRKIFISLVSDIK